MFHVGYSVEPIRIFYLGSLLEDNLSAELWCAVWRISELEPAKKVKQWTYHHSKIILTILGQKGLARFLFLYFETYMLLTLLPSSDRE